MMTHSPQAGLRKAAILVAALDRSAADDVLERMGERQALQVRQAVVELGPVDPQEQRRVIDEFFRVGPMVPRQQPSGVELDGRLDGRSPHSVEAPMPEDGETDAPPFQFLRQAECEETARLLTSERPQTIALVLSHLSPEQAGGVLVLLTPSAQAEVVRRLVDLEETDAEVLREVERGLQSRLARRVPMRRRRVAGAAAVKGILEASGQAVGRRILDNLANHDRKLAGRFAPPAPEIGPVAFDDLVDMDGMSLAIVIDAAEPDLLTLALVGATTTVIEQMLHSLPVSRARVVRQALQNLPPTRLSDVETARERLAETAGSLAAAGRIRLPEGKSLLRMTA